MAAGATEQREAGWCVASRASGRRRWASEACCGQGGAQITGWVWGVPMPKGRLGCRATLLQGSVNNFAVRCRFRARTTSCASGCTTRRACMRRCSAGSCRSCMRRARTSWRTSWTSRGWRASTAASASCPRAKSARRCCDERRRWLRRRPRPRPLSRRAQPLPPLWRRWAWCGLGSCQSPSRLARCSGMMRHVGGMCGRRRRRRRQRWRPRRPPLCRRACSDGDRASSWRCGGRRIARRCGRPPCATLAGSARHCGSRTWRARWARRRCGSWSTMETQTGRMASRVCGRTSSSRRSRAQARHAG